MTQGEAILVRLQHRFKNHHNVIDALCEELAYLTLEGWDDHEVQAEEVITALRSHIALALADRKRCKGNNRGWPPAP